MGRTGTRGAAAAGLMLSLVFASVDAASAQQASCAKADFEAVVETAAASLRDLNQRNKPTFQDKLRSLKDKRGWTTEQYMTEAAVYVQDDKIAELDNRSSELLAHLNSVGETGAASAAPDCKLLAELRNTMKALVDTQTAKWTYMFSKIDQALAH